MYQTRLSIQFLSTGFASNCYLLGRFVFDNTIQIDRARHINIKHLNQIQLMYNKQIRRTNNVQKYIYIT